MDPVRIAAAMNLPLKTVNNFINNFKFKNITIAQPLPAADLKKSGKKSDQLDFLDIFIYSKTRHSIIDISGSVDKKSADKLKDILSRIKSSHRNPVALKMTDVKYIDNFGADAILSLFAEFKLIDRYFAILDPSNAVEPALKQYGVDGTVPIFGTEIAFEEHAFR
jgi:anti-anti-sigma factor